MGRIARLAAVLFWATRSFAAESPADPTFLGGNDAWSAFANKWSPEVQARIYTLREQLKNATAEAAKAKRELAQERQIATSEAPNSKVWESRLARAQRGWMVAVLLLLCSVGGVYYLGHVRGAWGLNPMTLLEKPPLREPLLSVNGDLQEHSGGWHEEKLRAELSRAEEAAAKAKGQEQAAKRALTELQHRHAQAEQEAAHIRAQEAGMRKALKEMQARADASRFGESQDAAAVREIQELHGQLQSELAEARHQVAEARAQEGAAKQALQDLRGQADMDAKRTEKVMQDMHDELLFLRARGNPTGSHLPQPPASPHLNSTPSRVRPSPPLGSNHALNAVPPPPLGTNGAALGSAAGLPLPLVPNGHLPMASVPAPDASPRMDDRSRAMPMRALSPSLMRPQSPGRMVGMRGLSPAGLLAAPPAMVVAGISPGPGVSPGTSRSASTYALHSPSTSSLGNGAHPPQRGRATVPNPPGRFHLVAETGSCQGMTGAFGVGGVA